MVASNKKTMEIRLKRFQPSKMQTNRICVMVGKKGTGKSTLVQDIMWFQQHIPVGAIMSATEEANEAYGKMAPPLFIYKNFDADALVRLINRQKKMKHMWKENGDSLPFDHRAFVLMDDCMYDKKNFRGPLMRELFMNGRHWDLFVLITLQYVMDITPEIRTNTDYVFALKENVKKNRERLYNEFFGVFPNFAVFDALFLEVTQDWRCLVLDTTVPSTNIPDCVFWYKAEKRPEFRLGADWFWEYSQKNGLGKHQSNAEMNALNEKLEEMNQKAVTVVFEGQRRKRPAPPTPAQQRQPSNIQFRTPGRPPPPQQPKRIRREAPEQHHQQWSQHYYDEEPVQYRPPPQRATPEVVRRRPEPEMPTVIDDGPSQRAAYSAPNAGQPQVLHAPDPRHFGGFIY
uniref:Uncharacterized protein n=1 Tax=viral metagenome TaxID=1070528 RepID=A0A6C0BNY4_9ZZZZ